MSNFTQLVSGWVGFWTQIFTCFYNAYLAYSGIVGNWGLLTISEFPPLSFSSIQIALMVHLKKHTFDKYFLDVPRFQFLLPCVKSYSTCLLHHLHILHDTIPNSLIHLYTCLIFLIQLFTGGQWPYLKDLWVPHCTGMQNKFLLSCHFELVVVAYHVILKTLHNPLTDWWWCHGCFWMGRTGGLKDMQKMIAPTCVFAEPAIVLQIELCTF